MTEIERIDAIEMTPKKNYLIPRERLEHLRITVDLPLDRWTDLLGIRLRDYKAMSTTDHVQIDFERLLMLSDNLDLAPESILSGKLDFSALAALHSGDALSIPEEFSCVANSKVRTSSHLLDVLEYRYGWRERARILRGLQVTEAYLSNPDHPINVRFVTELCDSMHRRGVSTEMFQTFGGYSVIKNYHSPLGDLFRSLKLPLPEAMEYAFTEIIRHYYDQNFLYRVKKAREGLLIVEARCNPDVLDGLRVRRLGNAPLCSAKAGSFATVTGYFRLPSAQVTESRCVHRGDPLCRFEIDYSAALNESMKRRRAPAARSSESRVPELSF